MAQPGQSSEEQRPGMHEAVLTSNRSKAAHFVSNLTPVSV
jgi:hypothetical protein